VTEGSKTDVSVSIAAANWYSLLTGLPLAAMLAFLFSWRWGFPALWQGFGALFHPLSLIPSLVLGILAHELLHAAGWGMAGGLKLTELKLGFQVKTLTPYAHALVPLRASAYRVGVVLPFLVLGLFPALGGIVLQFGWGLAFGAFYTITAGGDLLILWLLRKIPPSQRVEDHPSRAGFYVLEN
jgi:hypothetical protein